MPHLECVNEEFQHYFIVDTPPSSPRKRAVPAYLVMRKSIYKKVKCIFISIFF